MKRLVRMIAAALLALSVTLLGQGSAAATGGAYSPGGWVNPGYTPPATYTGTAVDSSLKSGTKVSDKLGMGKKLGMFGLAGGGLAVAFALSENDYKSSTAAQISSGQAEQMMRALGTAYNCNGTTVNAATATYTTYGVTGSASELGITGPTWEPIGLRDSTGKGCFAMVAVATNKIHRPSPGCTVTQSGDICGAGWKGYFTVPPFGANAASNLNWQLPFDTGQSQVCGVGSTVASGLSMPIDCQITAGKIVNLGGTGMGTWQTTATAPPIKSITVLMGANGFFATPQAPNCTPTYDLAGCTFLYSFTFKDAGAAAPIPITETLLCDSPTGTSGGQRTATATWYTTDTYVMPLSCPESFGTGWSPRNVKICQAQMCSEVSYPAATGTKVAIDPNSPGGNVVTGVDLSTSPNGVTSGQPGVEVGNNGETTPTPQTATTTGPRPKPENTSCHDLKWSANPLNWAFDAFKNAGIVLFIPCDNFSPDWTGVHPQIDKWSLPVPDNLWPGEGCGGVTVTMPHKYFNDYTHTYLNTCEAPYSTIKNWLYPLTLLAVMLVGTAAAWERLTKGLGIVLYDVSKNSGQMGLW